MKISRRHRNTVSIKTKDIASGGNVTYRKERKAERSEALLSPDKLAANRRFAALSGSRSGSDNIIIIQVRFPDRRKYEHKKRNL